MLFILSYIHVKNNKTHALITTSKSLEDDDYSFITLFYVKIGLWKKLTN